MHKNRLSLVLTICISGIFIISCHTSPKRSEGGDKLHEAKEDIRKAEHDISDVVKDSIHNFKIESEEKIRINEEKIAEFQEKMSKKGKSAKAEYVKRIDELKQKNRELKNKLNAFKDNEQDKWAAFKREFNHDMDELGRSLKDLTVDNTD